MIHQDTMHSFNPSGAVLAKLVMSSEDNKTSMKKNWDSGSGVSGEKPVFFLPEELDIYCNKTTLDAYIFHGKDIDYESIDHLEYDPKDYSVDIILKNGKIYDLGVKIQWLVRPYFSKANHVFIVKTKDNVSIDGTMVPLIHKEKTNQKKSEKN